MQGNANSGEVNDGAEGADREGFDGEPMNDEIGFPRSEQWSALEQRLRAIDEETKRAEAEAVRIAEEMKS